MIHSFILLLLTINVDAFITKVPTRTQHRSFKNLDMLLPNNNIDPMQSSMFLQAVEVFDGSTIADPIVVSGVFWTSLKAKIISVLIGQMLAAIVFALLTYIISTQLSSLGEFVATNIFKENTIKTNLEKISNSISNERKSSVVQPDFQKLLLCVVIDTLGTASELIPFIGEISDVLYAPIAALALRSLYGNSNVIFALEFAEEFLPFTDILPLATICWVSFPLVIFVSHYHTLTIDLQSVDF
jgi:hypothetical protein